MKNILYIIALTLLFYSCNEEKALEPVVTDSIPPGVITDIVVKNMPGGAKIEYLVPDDTDLAYIKAEFNRNGVASDTRSSGYTNSVLIEGLSDLTPQDVKLYSVDKSENISSPVTVKIEPNTPPYLEIYNNLEITPDWGGALFSWKNETEAPIYIDFMAEDSTSELLSRGIYVTSKIEDSKALRGFEAEPMKFAAIISDRWNNYSDTIIKTVTPLYEIEFNKEEFNELYLDNDADWNGWRGVYEDIYDGEVKETFGHTMAGATPWPNIFSVDLGGLKKLSRMKLWQRHDNLSFVYTHGNPKWFKVYGSAELPSQSGDLSEWTLLADCTIEKPSGLPIGQEDEEDLQAIYDGHEFVFDVTTPEIRYIRVAFGNYDSETETWSSGAWDGAGYIAFGELSFFGQSVGE